MGFTNKFAESFARSKTMTGPERKANEIMGKLLLKKAIVPIILDYIISKYINSYWNLFLHKK